MGLSRETRSLYKAYDGERQVTPGSDHEGDGGWPFRDVRKEREVIKKLRKIVPSEGQQVLEEDDPMRDYDPDSTSG